MLVRIVHLQIKMECVDAFREMFSRGGARVQTFEGCNQVQLLESEQGVFMSYSVWESEDALNAYRNSAFFRATWPKLKEMFREKAQAWSASDLPLNTSDLAEPTNLDSSVDDDKLTS